MIIHGNGGVLRPLTFQPVTLVVIRDIDSGAEHTAAEQVKP